MTSIPTNYCYNLDSLKYKYLERLDKSPEIPDLKAKTAADKFLLRRNRMMKKSSTSDKLKAAVGSLIGTVIPVAMMMKKQGVKNPLKLKYGLKEMLVLSGTPILGGVTIGMLGNDAESNWGKSREGVFQFLNAAIPTWLAGAALSLCENSKKMNNIPAKILSIVGAVLIGVHGAASLSNKICDPQDKRPDRKLTLRDSIANLDDLVAVLVLAKFPIVDKLHLESVIPAIFAYCGYRAGKSN